MEIFFSSAILDLTTSKQTTSRIKETIEDDLKNKDDLKNETTSKMKMTQKEKKIKKMNKTSKNKANLKSDYFSLDTDIFEFNFFRCPVVEVLRLKVGFVLPLSQEEQAQQEQPPSKFSRRKYTLGLEFGKET